ncbi:MAG: alpha/beta fold hydrolase [Actinomycetota bacterium]
MSAGGRGRLRGTWIARPWGRMRVWTAGEGPALLAVHGIGGSGRYWAALAGVLGDRFRIVAPDLAGFGASDKPRGAPYDVPFHVADLDASLGDEPGPVCAVGHSLGGVLAASWAAASGRASSLALLATPFPPADGAYAWMREGDPPSGSRVVTRTFRILVPLLSLPVGVARRYPPGVAFDYGRQGFVGRARTTWWTLHDPAAARALGEGAERLRDIPTLLLNARDDRTVDLAAQDRWAELLPSAERLVGPGGHQFPLRAGLGPLVAWLDGTLRS